MPTQLLTITIRKHKKAYNTTSSSEIDKEENKWLDSRPNRKAPLNATCAQRALAKLLGGKERRFRGAETGIAVKTLYLCECRRPRCASSNDTLHTRMINSTINKRSILSVAAIVLLFIVSVWYVLESLYLYQSYSLFKLFYGFCFCGCFMPFFQ